MPNPFVPVSMPPVQQYVYLFPQRDSEGGISWMWAYNGASGSAASFPVIEAHHGKNDIQFTIVDFNPQPITFAPGNDSNGHPNGLWLSEKDTATAKHPGIYVNQNNDFQSPVIEPSTIKLTDLNKKNAEFVYQLNFAVPGRPEIKVPSIDPTITNGDGGQLVYPSATLLIAAAAAAALAVAFVRLALGWRAR